MRKRNEDIALQASDAGESQEPGKAVASGMGDVVGTFVTLWAGMVKGQVTSVRGGV